MRKLIIGLALFALIGASQPAAAAGINLVTNGDFSQGNIGFSSDYTAVDPSVAMSCWDPGIYAIAASADPCHPLWTTAGDHTTGDGNMMLVNGRTDSVSSVYFQDVTVKAGTQYSVEAFLMNLCCKSGDLRPGAALSFYVNDDLIGVGGSGSAGMWQGLSASWFSGAATTARLRIENSTTVYDGNDFALDDLFLGETDLTAAPEPASLLLLGTAFALYGRKLRRRKPLVQR